jgi:YVTN family beta-propeller protein
MFGKRGLRLAAILIAAVIELSCGDTFRPIAIPQNPHPPDPESLHFALVLSANGPDVCPVPDPNCDNLPHAGSSIRIDVSGDTNVGTATVGLGPVHAALLPPNGSAAYVANSLEDTLSAYPTGTPSAVATISLPAGSSPSFVHTTQTDTVYVANSGLNNVSVISTSRNVVTQTIEVGNNPVALAETPDGRKLYVVNQGSNNVTPITIVDKVAGPPIATGTSPILAVARSDNARVYVLNQGGVSVIDTINDVVSSTVPVSGANYMFYDRALGRLYLTIPGIRQLAVVNVAADPPVPLPNIDLSAACPAGCILDSVASLPDGSKTYVSSHQVSDTTCSHLDGVPDDVPPCVTTRVTAIKTPSNTVMQTLVTQRRILVNSVPVGFKSDAKVALLCNSVRFRRHIAAAGDGSRIYVANCDAGGTDIIRTSNDTFALDLTSPVSSLPRQPGQDFPPPQNPVFVLPGR